VEVRKYPTARGFLIPTHPLLYVLASVMALGFPLVGLARSGSSPAATPAAPAARDWTSWGYDQERTSWNRGETQLSKANVSKLRLQWSA
jgi:hypothetical protein